jgi:hypothetical protein
MLRLTMPRSRLPSKFRSDGSSATALIGHPSDINQCGHVEVFPAIADDVIEASPMSAVSEDLIRARLNYLGFDLEKDVRVAANLFLIKSGRHQHLYAMVCKNLSR